MKVRRLRSPKKPERERRRTYEGGERAGWRGALERSRDDRPTPGASRERGHLILAVLTFQTVRSEVQMSLRASLTSPCEQARSLLSCLTLGDALSRSPPGSSIHRSLQARTLEWAALVPGDLPDPGVKPASLTSPAAAGESSLPPGNPASS